MKIGPYSLIEELGRGGMAQVWLAHRIWEDGKRRSCVLKFPRLSVVTDTGVLRQFLEESRLAILLRHNNIVSVFDAGVHEGLPYLVMDYVAGKDLAQMVRAAARLATPFDVETAVHVVREIGQALLHAHEFEYNGVPQRIVHRDVASKNVMIDGSGGVLLMDFGVATSLQTQTSRMHVKGTLSYMAPEHYLGQATAISDVFGLGGIFWELLAGRPFRAALEGQPLIAAVVSGTVEPVGRELPAEIQRVLDGMLEPTASRRITLREVLSALEAYPSRRMALREMVSEYFGRAGKRTGLSQIHFAASKELADTFAVVKVAGVSISDVQRLKVPGQPEAVPADFVPEKKDATAKVDPLANGGLDDDLDEVAGAVPPASDVEGASAITDLWKAPGGTVRAPRTPAERSPWTPLKAAEPVDDVAPSVAMVSRDVDARAEESTGDGSAASASTPGGTPIVVRPTTPPQVLESGDSGHDSGEPSAASQQPENGTNEESRWSPSGGTLRSPDSEVPQNPPPAATVRLQMGIAMSSITTEPSDGADAKTRTVFLPPPVTEPGAPSSVDAGSKSAPEPSAPIHTNAQRFTDPVAAASGGMAASHELDERSPRSSPRMSASSRPASAKVPAAHGQSWRLLAAAVVLLVVGVGAWLLWPEVLQRPQDAAERPRESSVAMANSAPVTTPSEPATPEGTPDPEAATVAKTLAAGASIEAAGEVEPKGAMTDAPGLAEPSEEPGLEPSKGSPPSAAPDPASESEPIEADVDGPEPAGKPVPAKPDPAAAADENPPAKAKPRAPKPVAKVALVVRRGLMVDFAEIRVGRGKAQTVPLKGSLTVQVAPGNYTLRYRTKPDAEWRSLGWTFSSNAKYDGRLELNGLHIGSSPTGGQGS